MVPLCGVRSEMLLVAIAVVPAALRLFYVFARREPALAPAAALAAGGASLPLELERVAVVVLLQARALELRAGRAAGARVERGEPRAVLAACGEYGGGGFGMMQQQQPEVSLFLFAFG